MDDANIALMIGELPRKSGVGVNGRLHSLASDAWKVMARATPTSVKHTDVVSVMTVIVYTVLTWRRSMVAIRGKSNTNATLARRDGASEWEVHA